MAIEPKVTIHFATQEIVGAIGILASSQGLTTSGYCRDILEKHLKDLGVLDEHGCLNHAMLQELDKREKIEFHSIFKKES